MLSIVGEQKQTHRRSQFTFFSDDRDEEYCNCGSPLPVCPTAAIIVGGVAVDDLAQVYRSLLLWIARQTYMYIYIICCQRRMDMAQ